VRKVTHRTPESTSRRSLLMERRHHAGGARIEQSREKICSTTMAWPQCVQTKVGVGAADSSSADSSGAGGATLSSSRAVARLSLRLPLASLALARELLGKPAIAAVPADGDDHPVQPPTFVCWHCGHPMLILQTFARSHTIRAPPARPAR
jgi:hypothetical protein